MKIISIGLLFLYLNTVLASPSALQAENTEYEGHSKCYAGWVVKPPSDNPTKVKFNIPNTKIYEYMAYQVDGTYVREDYEGNKVEQEEIYARCFKNEGSIITSVKIRDSQELAPGAETIIALGSDNKNTYRIVYEDDYPRFFYEVLGQLEDVHCDNLTAYSYEGELGHIEEKIFYELRPDGCGFIRGERYEGGSMKLIFFLGKKGSVGDIKRESLMSWSEKIPSMRLCIRWGYGDREYGNKYVDKIKGHIQKGILYGMVSKKEMNAKNRIGQIIADSQQNNFREWFRDYCNRFQTMISVFKIENTEDAY